MADLSPEERAIVVRGFELLASADPSKSTVAPGADAGPAAIPERNHR
jgi:hypothetical protein